MHVVEKSLSVYLVLAVLMQITTRAEQIPDTFFPFGPTTSDSVLFSASTKALDQPISIKGGCFRYFDKCENTVFVLENGGLSFGELEGSKSPEPFPTRIISGPFIGAYWTDVDLSRGAGNVFSREVETISDQFGELPFISQTIIDAFETAETAGFNATWALIVTYDDVPQAVGTPLLGNTFQILIAQDDTGMSFALFFYAELQWSLSRDEADYNDAVVGFDAGLDMFSQSVRGAHFNVPNVGSGTPNVVNIAGKTNTKSNICGLHVFRIDENEIEQPCIAQICGNAIDCNNNGQVTCSPEGPVCECDAGFTGRNCQASVDDCAGVDCGFGQCIDGDNTFTCLCRDGFTGDFCETNINDCASVDCLYGGECIDGIDSFTCCCGHGVTVTNDVCTRNNPSLKDAAKWPKKKPRTHGRSHVPGERRRWR